MVLLAALALVPACGDDPVQPAGDSSGNTQTFLSLTTRDAVLNNLEVAWDKRVPSRIDDLLDDNFTFFFQPGDVGGSIPAQWSRVDELQTTNDLLISNTQPIPTGPVCTSVHVDLSANNVQWVPLVPEDYPAETWYTTTVFYSATFEMAPANTYLTSPGAKAEFTVREVAVGNGTEWRLVEWRDLGNTVAAGERQTAGSESTWGSIKALYH